MVWGVRYGTVYDHDDHHDLVNCATQTLVTRCKLEPLLVSCALVVHKAWRRTRAVQQLRLGACVYCRSTRLACYANASAPNQWPTNASLNAGLPTYLRLPFCAHYTTVYWYGHAMLQLQLQTPMAYVRRARGP